MAIRFNTELLVRDVDAARKRRNLSVYRTALRMGIDQATLIRLRSGASKDITVTTLARVMHFLGHNNIEKYIYDDGENQNGCRV